MKHDFPQFLPYSFNKHDPQLFLQEKKNAPRDLPRDNSSHQEKKKKHIAFEQKEKKKYKYSSRRIEPFADEKNSPGVVPESEETKKSPEKKIRRTPPPFPNPLSAFFPVKFFCILLIVYIVLSLMSLHGAPPVKGTSRDSNFNLTKGYGNTRIEAQLVVGVKENTKVLHFIRDNNDPRVVTKTYHIKNVDAYEFRDYLRQMVQSKRVGNTSLLQQYPVNSSAAAGVPVTATVSTPVAAGASNSPIENNAVPVLGSNTSVECLKYADGTSLLIVSAEEYRFKDHKNGMGIDSIVKFLDKPQMGAFLGTQTFFYIPKYVPARNLLPLIQNVGMNISDVTEIWQGADVVTNDPDLNWLLFDVTNYSMKNIQKMLCKFDRPIPQVYLTVTVYEFYDENDEKMGLDFQAWKNSSGVDFFSGGGRFRNNWSSSYGGNMLQSGSERTRFFNFNPKWNSRYIDFLVSTGKAKAVHTGEICVRNNTGSTLDRTTEVFYIDASNDPAGTQITPDMKVNAYKLLSQLLEKLLPEDIPVAKGKALSVQKSDSFGFTMKINNASVNERETYFDLQLKNTSLIGFTSSGAPRIAPDNSIDLKISLPHTEDSFIIGGLKKQNIVTSSNGIPYLSKIPFLGYLFSTKSKSVKNAELVVVCKCRKEFPGNMREAELCRWKKEYR